MPDDSVKKTVMVALGVCLVCSVLVSTAAVSLNAIQNENKKLDRIKNILMAGGLLGEKTDVRAVYEQKVKPAIIDLKTGESISSDRFDDVLNTTDFDLKQVCASPEYGMDIPANKDIARIRRMPRYMIVYQVQEGGETQKVILPIYGKGLWSTLFGFIAFEKDMKTVAGFTFYEHGETPGLGGEVDNPRWKSQWKGKIAYDDNGHAQMEVLKGKVDPARPEAAHEVDGLTGATMTTRGVDQLVKFWLGDDGYGPYLNKLRQEG